jgi:hypothetical protein
MHKRIQWQRGARTSLNLALPLPPCILSRKICLAKVEGCARPPL